jgi:hypothetical protein
VPAGHYVRELSDGGGGVRRIGRIGGRSGRARALTVAATDDAKDAGRR